MKRLLLFYFTFLLFSAFSCNDEEIISSIAVMPCNKPDNSVYVDTQLVGSVTKMLEVWVINVKNNEKAVRCIPCNLPENFKVENQEIKLDASFLEIPPNVRMLGQPIEIKKIY